MRDNNMDTWNETCEKQQAWEKATTDFIENGMVEDAKWKRCVKSGAMSKMNRSCWTDLLRVYGN